MEDGLLFNQIELLEKIAFKSENGNYDVIFFESLDDLISLFFKIILRGSIKIKLIDRFNQ